MSDGMPGVVSKGKVLFELEEVLRDSREKLREELLCIDGSDQDTVADALE